jgi:Concanavalin A-like lectin/glucanases superfamily
MSSRNSFGAKFALAVGFVLAMSWAGSAARAQVIAHWSFDSQAGGVYPDQTGTHNATVVTNGTGAITSGPGRFGNAAAFNNATGVQATNNAYMTLPQLTELAGPSGTSFSVAAWVQTTNAASNNPILADWGTATTTNRFTYWFSSTNSGTASQPRAQFRSSNSPNTDIVARQAAVNVGDGAFHHIAWTWDKPTKLLTTYVDGVQVDTFTSAQTNVDILPSDSALGMIGRKSDTNNFFVGTLDELWVFNRALTAGEVSGLFTANSIAAVPEPTSLGMLSAAAAGALLQWRRRRLASGTCREDVSLRFLTPQPRPPQAASIFAR